MPNQGYRRPLALGTFIPIANNNSRKNGPKIMASADIVFGSWQGPNEPDGVGIRV